MSHSAGEHEWREVEVSLRPLGARLQISVRTRKHRGTDLIWDRRLGVHGVDIPPGADTTLSGLLRLCVDALEQVANDADRL